VKLKKSICRYSADNIYIEELVKWDLYDKNPGLYGLYKLNPLVGDARAIMIM